MSQANRGIRDALKSIVPNWLSNRLKRNTGFKVLWTWALLADGLVEVMLEGFRAAMPGKGTPTALGLIGQSRGIPRGIGESADAYAARLREWLTLWENAGSDETLMALLQAFLGVDNSRPLSPMRIVDRRGNFTSIDQFGVTSRTVDTNWNWDSISNPERSTWWSDIWIIVYVDASRWQFYTGLLDFNWTQAWGDTGGFGWGEGHTVTREYVDGIMSIIATFKGAHTFINSVIITTDNNLFVPGSLGVAGNPNGKWGSFSYTEPSTGICAPIRTTITGAGNIRYWCPAGGG